MAYSSSISKAKVFGSVLSKYKDESQIPVPLGLGLCAGHDLDNVWLISENIMPGWSGWDWLSNR